MSDDDQNTNKNSGLVNSGEIETRRRKPRKPVAKDIDPAFLHEMQHALAKTEEEIAARLNGVKRPRGRPTLGDHAMSTAERVKQMRQRDAAAVAKVRALLTSLRESHPDLVAEVVNDPDVKSWLERK